MSRFKKVILCAANNHVAAKHYRFIVLNGDA